MVTTQSPTARTTNPNDDPRLKSTKDVARPQGISYKRDNNAAKSQKRDVNLRK
jgi:hypothetical protein